jgi:hypothetical protein
VVDVHEQVIAPERLSEPVVQSTRRTDGIVSAVIDENLTSHDPAPYDNTHHSAE